MHDLRTLALERFLRPSAEEARRPLRLARLLGFGGLFVVLVTLGACATFQTKPVAPSRPPVHAELRLELLSVGMSIHEVERLEPKPDRIMKMESQTMTVEKWIYETSGRPVELYFTNGFLESW
jgi:hypothetical protein